MASLDFPSSPTVGQKYTAASGAVYTWDGAAWTLGGPITASPVGAAGGDLSGTYPNPTYLTVGAQVNSSTYPTIAHNTVTSLSFDTVVVNRGSAWSAGTPTRIALPVTGVYLIGAAVEWSFNANGGRTIYIQTKGGANITECNHGASTAASTATRLFAQTLYVVTDPTDWVQVLAFQNSGVGLALTGVKPLFYAWRLAT